MTKGNRLTILSFHTSESTLVSHKDDVYCHQSVFKLSVFTTQDIPPGSQTKDPMDKSAHAIVCRVDKRSHTTVARVEKTSHTDLTGWTKDPILIFHPGQNVPFLST